MTLRLSKVLKVRFIGDSATVDDGGPRREFLSILIKDIFNMSGLFNGWPNNVCPVHNVKAVAENKFWKDYSLLFSSRWGTTRVLSKSSCRLHGE